jgi:hypothetical protein
MNAQDAFRDFGLLLAGSPPPAGCLRSALPWYQVLFQYLMSLVLVVGFGLGGLGMLVAAAFQQDAVALGAFLTGGSLLLAIAVFGACHVRHTNLWVELDGPIIRARNLYSLRITERHVHEVVDILTHVWLARERSEIRLAELFQGRVRGFEIRFLDTRDGFRVYRPEMRNVRELIEGIMFRMAERGRLVPEIVALAGRPLIRRITWADRFDPGQTGV